MSDDIRINSRPLKDSVPGANKDEVFPIQGKKAVIVGKTLPEDPLAKKTSEAGKNISADNINNAVKRANEYISQLNREIHFQISEKTGRTIITVLDSKTREVIRQIPPDEIFRLAEFLQEEGHLIQIKV